MSQQSSSSLPPSLPPVSQDEHPRAGCEDACGGGRRRTRRHPHPEAGPAESPAQPSRPDADPGQKRTSARTQGSGHKQRPPLPPRVPRRRLEASHLQEEETNNQSQSKPLCPPPLPDLPASAAGTDCTAAGEQFGIEILRKKLLNRWLGSVIDGWAVDAICSHRSPLDLFKFLSSRMM